MCIKASNFLKPYINTQVKLHVATSNDEQEWEDQGQVEGLRQLNQTIYMCTCKWTETNLFTICNEIMKNIILLQAYAGDDMFEQKPSI